MKMASKYNKRIEDFFTRQIQQEVAPPGQSGNTSIHNKACDPPNPAQNAHDDRTSTLTLSTDCPALFGCRSFANHHSEEEWRNLRKSKFIREKQRTFTVKTGQAFLSRVD